MTTETRHITHTIRLPAVTDVEQLLGAYRALFESIGISHSLMFEASGGFTHPIPEEQEKLKHEFMETMRQLQDTKMLYGELTCVNATIGNSTVVFVFSYPAPVMG